ncbi:MAG: glycosyltransferase family 39 protein [Parcubacteria group bacterium]|jgi:4-amino-4-deoxy-L-arabinose transferase-like glycosyltransferase
MKKERIITISLFFIIVVSSFFFGFSRLKNFSGVDEPYWQYDRVPKFWKNAKEMDWKHTNISDKPGVPLAIVSGAGLPFIDGNPKNLKSLRSEPKTPQEMKEIRDVYFKLRFPVFLFTLAMLPLFYFLIKKLLGKRVARFSLLFIGLSPILLGISLIINSDAILWILTALSTLSLFVFLKNSEKKYLILSGFLLGLSVITKYVANILFVYFFLVFFLEYIFHAHKRVAIGKYLKQALGNYILLFLMAMATAFVFFPATWVKFSVLIKATVGNDVFSSTWPLFAGVIGLLLVDTFVFKAKFSSLVFDFLAKYRALIAKTFAGLFLAFSVFVFLHVWAHLRVFDLQAIISSPKGIGKGGLLEKFGGALTADIYSLLFSVSPLILVLILFAIGNIFWKKELKRSAITVVYILIFLFIYYLGSAVNKVVTTPRYQIMIYPLVFVVAAIGMDQILEIKKIKKYFSPTCAYAVAIIVLLGSLFIVRPNFLAYASELLPKSFIVNLKGMGEGSFEAATYLNSLPGAHEMTIWSDKGAVCEVFAG